MSFEDDFPSITLLAKPSIHPSPMTPECLCIVYPYLPDGAWIHKEEMMKYCLDKDKVRAVIKKISWSHDGKGTVLLKANKLIKELNL